MQYNAAYVMTFSQAQMLPSFTSIYTLKYANTSIGRTAGVDLTAAQPNDIARPVDSNIAYGHYHLVVKNRME